VQQELTVNLSLYVTAALNENEQLTTVRTVLWVQVKELSKVRLVFRYNQHSITEEDVLTASIVALFVSVYAGLVRAVTDTTNLSGFLVVYSCFRTDFANDTAANRNLVDFL
jgi:hypothetical protein